MRAKRSEGVRLQPDLGLGLNTSVLSDASTKLVVVLSTDQKGAIVEAEVAPAAIRLGVGVFKPLGDGERYDLIFDLRPTLMRVQCKSAVLKGQILRVPCFSARRGRDGFVKRYYTAAEVDAIAAYNIELDRCFFIPMARIPGRTYLQLRLEPCRNNQQLGVNWAEHFSLDARLRALLGP